MANDMSGGEPVKLSFKLPARLRRELKVRAAELGIEIQAAVDAGIKAWMAPGTVCGEVDVAGAEAFSTYLQEALADAFKAECVNRHVSYVQGLAQTVTLWLGANPSDGQAVGFPQRIIVCNQKGGVGKTDVAAGVAQAKAEQGKRVLLIDFDPQGHLSIRLGVARLGRDDDSLARHMRGEPIGPIADLVTVLPHERFGGNLHVVPASKDAFLLDVSLGHVRGKEMSMERALAAIEDQYDVVVVDCPPSLGLSVDAAIYYGRQRDGEPEGVSGVLIPVQAEDSSSDAFIMLMEQITELCSFMSIKVSVLGLIVNMYDQRRGYIATSSLHDWQSLGTPPVIAVIQDLKELREARRAKQPLLVYAPDSSQAEAMREIARVIS